ncbi:MAG: ComF family protein [Actinobacteria bacterium]|nr:ComF family protein [Actinomycetota bacterium]
MLLGHSLQDLMAPGRCVACRRPGSLLCPQCADSLARPRNDGAVEGIDRTLAAWDYDGAARTLILALKVGGRRAAAGPPAAAMCERARAVGIKAGVVTWVPGRRGDQRRRGFDHAEVLARLVAAGLGLPARALLRRRGPARLDQTTLGASERWINLHGAFIARASPTPVLLVDDLVTTGATASSCAGALQAAGAPGVEALVACRA